MLATGVMQRRVIFNRWDFLQLPSKYLHRPWNWRSARPLSKGMDRPVTWL